MAVQIQLTLVIRNGCHLCDAAQADLARVIGRFTSEHPDVDYHVAVVDINDQVDYHRFTDEVPVLLLNGKQVSFWRIDEERAFQQLEALL
ncbi:MAG: hypothetical protein RL418_79 [Actinomycetota bacterium]|jgi:hypothetical protein